MPSSIAGRPHKQLDEVATSTCTSKGNDAGLIVSGAKCRDTSTLTHYNFIATMARCHQAKDFAFCASCPRMPPVKLFCRPSYEIGSRRHGSPFDYRFPAV